MSDILNNHLSKYYKEAVMFTLLEKISKHYEEYSALSKDTFDKYCREVGFE